MDLTAKANRVRPGPGGNLEIDIDGEIDLKSWIFHPERV
jgi:hypothetical protein